jgi:elongation factor P
VQATELRPGTIIKHQNDLYAIHRTEHRTPGNKRGFVQARMRNLNSGAMIDYRFRSEDEVERAVIDEVEMQYLYYDADAFYFMNTATYEQVRLSKETVGDRALYLIPDAVLKVEYFEGRPIDIEVPATVDLKVVETEPGIKGASATNVTKPAKLETGLVVQVPPFISEGEVIRVDTDNGSYLERGK